MALPKKQPERWSSKPPFQVVEDARPKLFPIRSWDLVTRQSDWMVRVAFWLVGTVLAVLQSWSFRHFVTADGIAYLDMSDFVVPGVGWRRIISGVWSPLGREKPVSRSLQRLTSKPPTISGVLGL